MKDDVRRVIEDLYSVSRQSLFNGIGGLPDDAAVGVGPFQSTDPPAPKRQCKETTRTSLKNRGWDKVCFVDFSKCLFRCMTTVPFFSGRSSKHVSLLPFL